MKIYFAGSIRGGRDDRDLYMELIQELKNYGEVLTEHVGDSELIDEGEGFTEKHIFDRDMDWVRESDVVVAEVTTPSLGVGYELGQSEALKKPILCLYRDVEGKKLSAMILGNSYFQTKKYNDIDSAKEIIKSFFEQV